MATEKISTSIIADDAVTNAKIGADAVSTTEIANDASISTSGSLTVSGNTTLSGTNNLGSNPTITLGNNTTFPTGIIESQTVYKYGLSSNSSYAHSGGLKIATRTSSSDASVESISVNGGYTYLYSYNGMMRIADGNTHWRAGELVLFDDDTDRNQAGTTTGGEKQRITVGREAYNNSSSGMNSNVIFEISCASYYSSDDTRYIYLATANISSATTATLYFTTGTPLYLKVSKIKGNVITERT